MAFMVYCPVKVSQAERQFIRHQARCGSIVYFLSFLWRDNCVLKLRSCDTTRGHMCAAIHILSYSKSRAM